MDESSKDNSGLPNSFLGERLDSEKLNHRRVEKTIPEKSFKKSFWKFSLFILFLCLLAWGWSKLINPMTFPVHDIQIRGNYSHLDHAILRQAILPYVQAGLLKADIKGLQNHLSHLPWVFSAKVQRVWPDIIEILIVEQQPIAKWSDHSLLNPFGDSFPISEQSVPANLPLFIGPLGQQKSMLEMYRAMTKVLAPFHLEIQTLWLDTRQSWQLRLNNGLTILAGKIEPLSRLQRFAKAYPQLINEKLASIQSVDLRYVHGAAIRYKNQIDANNRLFAQSNGDGFPGSNIPAKSSQ